MLRPVRTPSDGALLGVFVPEPRARLHAVAAIGVAVIVHGALALAVPSHAVEPPRADPPPMQMIEVLPPPPPPEPPPPVKPPPVAEPPPSAPIRPATPRSAPPAPAQAAAVLTQKPDPAAPADFTDSIVVGTAETYAGGATSAAGTTQRTVEVTGKPPGGTGVAATPAARAPGSDRSRRAHLAGGASWDCGFPREADEAQIDHAVVALRIAVSALGAADSVTIVADPGNGFGREARTCATMKHYEPALNRAGEPAPGTFLVNVRFDR
jgi:protein TonB